jgi:DNA-binding GntR family transcriptional regulator
MTRQTQLRPVDAVTLKDSVYRELFRAIVSGRLAPGERLVLDPLAKQLGVSIMPVREAIRKLEAGKLVTVRNRKITVNVLSPKNVTDILKVRLILEGYAASEGARLGQEETARRLEALLGEMEQTDDIEVYLKTNRAFHGSIYRECDNPPLLEVIESVWERYSPYLHILLDNEVDWKSPALSRNHYGMLDAYRKRDSEAIRRWVEKDLTDAAQLVLKMIERTDGDMNS